MRTVLLESLEVTQYGTEADQVEALRHLLQADPTHDPRWWHSALSVAVKSGRFGSLVSSLPIPRKGRGEIRQEPQLLQQELLFSCR